MLDAILGILGTGGAGGIIGLFGGWLSKRETRKMAEIQFKHDEKMAEFQAQEAKEEREQALALGEQNRLLAETEGQLEVEGKEVDAFVESIKSQAIQTGIKFVDGVRGLMRPLITLFLLISTAVIYYLINDKVGGLDALPASELIAIYKHVIEQIIFLTVLAVSWWFGSRKGQL